MGDSLPPPLLLYSAFPHCAHLFLFEVQNRGRARYFSCTAADKAANIVLSTQIPIKHIGNSAHSRYRTKSTEISSQAYRSQRGARCGKIAARLPVLQKRDSAARRCLFFYSSFYYSFSVSTVRPSPSVRFFTALETRSDRNLCASLRRGTSTFARFARPRKQFSFRCFPEAVP